MNLSFLSCLLYLKRKNNKKEDKLVLSSFFFEGEYMGNKNIWGAICECGNEVYDFYDDHPWMENADSIKLIKCNKCNKVIKINYIIASEFYNNKIFDCFKNVYGKVLEIGSGGELITNYVKSLEKVSYIATLDVDEASISTCSNKHYIIDLNNFDEGNLDDDYDFIICRDVLMYLDDIEYTFYKLSRISKKIVLLNWHDVNHKNCFNKTTPENILKILSKYYDDLIIEYPSFYKHGYLIKSKI